MENNTVFNIMGNGLNEEKPLVVVVVVDGEEFKCPICKLVQSNNWCFTCDTDNTCQNCVGHGGDDNTEGHEEWICQTCFDKQPTEREEEDYEYESSSSDDEDEEEDGIGCNECYVCVTGGAGKCVLDK